MTKLRIITEQDTENILRWRNNPNVRRNFIFQEILTTEIHTDWMNERVKTGKVVQFIIVDTVHNHDIGSAYLRDIDMNNKKAEFGLFIGEDAFRGKGHGSNATILVLDYAFITLGLNKVFLRVFSDNISAIRSYRKSGFSIEGLFQQDVIIDGIGVDVVFMAVIKSDYLVESEK